jgi:GNAT superfamily N-acetyltransferase
VDFVRGARHSPGGRSIIALRSTAKEGTVSRICSCHDEGVGVVTSRGDVRWVVTEHGVADLWGRSLRERALAMVGVAHPDFREELMAAAVRRRLVLPGQPIPRAVHPWREARTVVIDGAELLVRPVSGDDAERLQDLFYRMSDESVYRRFLAHRRTHPIEEMQQLADLDDEVNMALVACAPTTAEVVAIARYDVDRATGLADIAFAVRDDWQRRGLGTMLMASMTEIARARGIAGFQADVLATNRPMLQIFERSGLAFEGRIESGVYHLEAKF